MPRSALIGLCSNWISKNVHVQGPFQRPLSMYTCTVSYMWGREWLSIEWKQTLSCTSLSSLTVIWWPLPSCREAPYMTLNSKFDKVTVFTVYFWGQCQQSPLSDSIDQYINSDVNADANTTPFLVSQNFLYTLISLHPLTFSHPLISLHPLISTSPHTSSHQFLDSPLFLTPQLHLFNFYFKQILPLYQIYIKNIFFYNIFNISSIFSKFLFL